MEIIYTFWKDNQTDQIFKLTSQQIKDKFLIWMKTKETSWLKYYGYNVTMMHEFIGCAENDKGLQSVSDGKTDALLWDALKLVRNPYFNSLNI